jgi:hypothetical protein
MTDDKKCVENYGMKIEAEVHIDELKYSFCF